MKVSSLLFAASLVLVHSQASATLLTGTFEGVMMGPQNDTSGYVTGTKGVDKLVGKTFTGTVTIDADRLPADNFATPQESHHVAGYNWISFSIDGFNFDEPTAWSKPIAHYDASRVIDYSSSQIHMWDYQRDANSCVSSGYFCKMFDLHLYDYRTLLEGDSLFQTVDWSDDDFSSSRPAGSLKFTYKYLDNDSGRRDSASGTLLLSKFSLNTANSDISHGVSVPEPSSLLLLAVGLVAVGARRTI